jgi:GT2 family glycosyltransferase/spore maturation protein CgeB
MRAPTPSRRRRGHAPTIAIVGTFDVANFGDLLFPELARHELERRIAGARIRRYSYRPMSSPPWPYPVRPVEDLATEIDDVDLLLVGGGHLVRFDKAVAPGYEPTASLLHHPTSYWLSPTLIAASHGVPAVWNAVGVSPATPDWARGLLASAVDAADYVAVRDPDSLAELRRVAPTAEVAQVPDTAFATADLLAALGPSAELGKLRESLGIDGPYVIVQPSTRLLPAAEQIRTAAAAVRRSGRLVVELPISPALGDRPGILGLDDVIPVEPWPDPMTIAGLIAGAESVVAHSLHLTIVAIGSGVPVFRLAAPEGSKYEAMSRFADVLVIDPDADDLPDRLVAARGRGTPWPDAMEQRAQVARHWDRVAASLEDDGPRRARRQRVVRRLLADIPAVLEDQTRESVESVAAATASMERVAAERDGMARRVETLEAERVTAADGYARVEALVKETNGRMPELHEGIHAQLAQLQQRASADRRLLEEEIALRDAKLIDASSKARELARANKQVARLRSDLDRLRRRRAVRLALRLSSAIRPIVRLMTGRGSSGRRASHGAKPAAGGHPPERGPSYRVTEEEARAFAQLVAADLPPSSRRSGPLVSIVVLNRDGVEHLARLMPALEGTTYRSFELIVVDNASSDASRTFLAGAPRSFPLTVLENDMNRSFSDGCNQGIARASGELILLLNNDIEPIAPGWLGRMVTTLEERHAAGVGARLIYPHRPGLDNAGDSERPDLTLQHRGIDFTPGDGVPNARNLGAGEDARSAAASEIRDVPALTGACLLLDRSALEAVGGLTEGYVYGTEDVDLCLKLRASGARLVYDGGAALWHHEYGTQNRQGREWKRENRMRNRQLFVDRWGPQLFRDVFVDRVRSRGEWSEEPLHVAITLTRDDAAAAWGDYYTARELGAACLARGWRVSYLERHQDRWYDVDRSVDVVISLLDALDLRRLPRHVVTVAWIRNWTHRWIGHPWFDDYDVVFASSPVSQRLIEERTAKTATLMPLATNPERFHPAEPSDDLSSDILFVGNYWGQPRGVLERLGSLSGGPSVGLYGKDWDETVLARHHRGTLPYERLPEAYASARVVLDDTAGPTMPYAAVNARVFDALACGALVISDNLEGIRELFDDEFPVATDAAELQALVDRYLADPDEARALAERYRAIVLERHTYTHRARQLQDALATWAESERFGVLIGAPDWERAVSWGDYHYARSLQRQLERRGHPSRVHVLPEWERTSSARDDVVVHLFGLTERRTRPAQVDLLWNISHPDLVTARACERYDAVLVASDTFAARLAPTVSVPVRPLHQATDPDRFFPDPTAPPHDVLFVGNARSDGRRVIDDLLPTTFDLAIYGARWTSALVDVAYVKGEYIPNEVLHRFYSAAKVVLSDHWEDMRVQGFLSNRLYDALASGAFVVSDDVAGMDREFEGAVVTYRTADDLQQTIAYYLDHEEERRALAERGRAIVLARHTFAQRAETILEETARLAARRPMRVEDWRRIEAWLRRRDERRAAWLRPTVTKERTPTAMPLETGSV